MTQRHNGRAAEFATLQLCDFATLSLCSRQNPGSDIPHPPSIHFSPPSGSYDQAIDVVLSSPDPGAAIYFTTDGSNPTPETGTRYSEAIHIPAGQPHVSVLRAAAYLPGGAASPAASATYFMNLNTAIPLLSLTVDPVDLWDETAGIFANPQFYGREGDRPAEIFYYDPQQGTGIQAPAGVRVHGARSRNSDKKSLRLYFRSAYGQPFLEYQVFPDSEAARYKRLVLHDGGQDFPAVSFNGTLLRNELVGNLARQAGGYATYSRPALLFINGQLWGVYNIRERIDDRYLQEQFQIAEADLLSGFEHRLEASYGDSAHWDNLIAFVTANDLTDEDNYNYVKTQVNLDNFIDYALIQIITANADWPHNNQLKFRDRANGRWHWMFWDSDFAFGLMTDSYIEKNMFTHIFDHEDELQQQSSLLLRKLLQNPQFKNQFLARLADLLNSVFSTENVLSEIDRLAAAIEQDIGYETRRWPGAGNWEAGVEYMREFARRRPDMVRQQTIDAFELPGVARLTITQPDKSGIGNADLGMGNLFRAPGGSITINGNPGLVEGTYFQGVELQLAAVPEPGYRFRDWGTPDLPSTPELTISLNEDLTLSPRFERDDGPGARPGSVTINGYGRDADGAPLEGLQGPWIELLVRGPGPADLRGWRVSDNDSLTATDEGSLILGDDPALASVPPGVSILLVPQETPANDRLFAEDDLSPAGSRLILYAANQILDTHSDPWFAIGDKDTLQLLAPGPTAALEDDVVIDTVVTGQ
jgi:hypothetical protein